MSYADVSFDARMATVEFRVAERAHITVNSDICRSCTTTACVHACPAVPSVPTAMSDIMLRFPLPRIPGMRPPPICAASGTAARRSATTMTDRFIEFS